MKNGGIMFKWFLQKKSRRIMDNKKETTQGKNDRSGDKTKEETEPFLAYQAVSGLCVLCERNYPPLVTTVFYRNGYDHYPGNYQHVYHHESCYEYIQDNVLDKNVLPAKTFCFFRDIQNGKEETKKALKEKAKRKKRQKEWKEIQTVMREANNGLNRPEPLILSP